MRQAVDEAVADRIIHEGGQAVVGIVTPGVGIDRNQRINPMQRRLPMHLSRRCGARTVWSSRRGHFVLHRTPLPKGALLLQHKMLVMSASGH